MHTLQIQIVPSVEVWGGGRGCNLIVMPPRGATEHPHFIGGRFYLLRPPAFNGDVFQFAFQHIDEADGEIIGREERHRGPEGPGQGPGPCLVHIADV